MSEKLSAEELTGAAVALAETNLAQPKDAGEWAAIAGTRGAIAKLYQLHISTLQREADEETRTRELVAKEYMTLCDFLDVIPDTSEAVISQLRVREQKRQREADGLREALEPFAKLLDRRTSYDQPYFGPWNADTERHVVGVLMGDLRRARASLSSTQQEQKGSDTWDEDEVICFVRFALARASSFAREVSPEAAGRIEGLSPVAAYLDAKRAIYGPNWKGKLAPTKEPT